MRSFILNSFFTEPYQNAV